MESTSTVETGGLAGRREWIGLAVLALPTLLLALDMSVLYLALPRLSVDLNPSSTQLLWITDIYGFMIAGFLVTMGNLGDRIGRRRLLMIGGVVFSLASLAAAYSVSPAMLIAARAVMGIAGATVMPSVLALISNMFRNAAQRAMAISLWMTCFMIGMAIGPLAGGLLLARFWWGSIFLLSIPVMGILLVTAPVLLPEYRDPRAGRLDLSSVALSLVAILPVIYGIKELAAGADVGLPVVAILVGAFFGVLFVRRQGKLADPLLDLGLLRNRSVSGALVLMLLGGGTISGLAMLFTQYLQFVVGLSPFQAGLWLVPYTVGMSVGSMLSPGLAKRMQPVTVVLIGLGVSLVGYLLLTQVPTDGGLGLSVTGIVVAFTGLAPSVVLGTGLIVGSAPPEKAGAASSLSQTSNELGVSLGVAVLGSVGTAVYGSQMAGALPGGIPAAAAATARRTIAGASTAAQSLPGQLGNALFQPARHAFTVGFDITAAVAAGIVALLAVLAFQLSRAGRRAAAATAEPAEDHTEATHTEASHIETPSAAPSATAVFEE